MGFRVTQSFSDEPPVWKTAAPPRRRQVPGSGLTIAALAVGLAVTGGVVWVALSWDVLMGDVLQWARWMLVLVQAGLWLTSAGCCVWQWKRRRTGLWIALTGGVLAGLFFWVSAFLLVASLPCPSFC